MLRVVPCAAVLLLALSSLPLAAGPVTLLSKADPDHPSGTAGGASEVAGISADGRYVVLVTNADNFLAGVSDGNAGNDVFFHDRVTDTTVLVSHAAGDAMTAGDAEAGAADLSADGRWVVFQSPATNLVAGQVDAPGPDVFLWDRDTGTTALVSHLPGLSAQEAGDCWGTSVINGDGSRIAFVSYAPDVVTGQSDAAFSSDVFLYDRAAGTNTLVSHASGAATTAAGDAWSPALSADGGWVVFESDATNLVAGQVDTNDGPDLVLHDRAMGTNLLVSHAAGAPATAGNDRSFSPRISANGGRIAYLSLASNLMAGQVDGNGDYDVFLYDRGTGASSLVSHALSSAATAGNFFSEEPDLSADGRYVAFMSQATDLVAASTGNWLAVFVYDQVTGTNTLVSRGAATPSGDSFQPRMSSDGAWIAFLSDATNLAPGQTDSIFTWDVFLWSRASGSLTLVTRTPGSATTAAGEDAAGLRISADGNWLALTSRSEALVDGIDDHNASTDVFLYDRAAGVNTLLTPRGGEVSVSADGAIASMKGTAMSNDGRLVAFTSRASNLPGTTDGNSRSDVFLYDRVRSAITLVSHASGSLSTTANGASGEPLPSTDGSVVVFTSEASNFVPGQAAPSFPRSQVYLYDGRTGEIILISHAAGSPSTPSSGGSYGDHAVSGDGRWVAFSHYGSDLVAGQVDGNGTNDVFLFDRTTGVTTVVSHTPASPTQTADAFSGTPSISADGRYIAFLSNATDLVPAQVGAGGIFLYDRMTGTTTRVSPASERPPRLSADGRWIVFSSSAADVVPGQVDTNSASDVFLWDRVSGTTGLVSRTPASPATTGDAGSTLGTYTPDAPVLSADGRWVVFASEATDLIAGQVGSGAVFLFDRDSGAVTLVSRSAGAPATTGNLESTEPAISADGRFVAYLSRATDLVPGQADQNISYDAFLYDRSAGTTSLVSHIPSSEVTTGTLAAFDLAAPRISADGAWVAFQSPSPDLVEGDHDGATNAFLYANPLPGRDLFTVPLCRIVDTRQAGQGPVLTSGVKRTLMIHGACGIPATARAVAVNVTAIEPTSVGNLNLHAGDLAPAATSTINFSTAQTRANNAILSLAFDGSGTLAVTPFVAGGGTVHVIVDVGGYFE